MRLLLLLIMISVGTDMVFGQKTIPLSTEGMVQIQDKWKFTPGRPTLDLSNILNKPLTSDQWADFKKVMLVKIAAAYNNIQDKTLGTEKLYRYLWGDNAYNQMVRELGDLNNFFSSPTAMPVTVVADPFFPTFSDFCDIQNAPVFDTVEKVTSNQYTLNIYQTDLFQEWLIDRYNNDYDRYIGKPVNIFTRMDLPYKSGWRELEGLYTQIYDTLASIRRNQDDATLLCRDEGAFIDSVEAKLEQNIIVNGLKDNPFFKHWIWLSDGLLTMNPLRATTDEKRYPAGEPFRARDSLKTAPPAVITLDQVQEARKLFNKVILPYSQKEEIHLIHYDYKDEMKKRADLILDSVTKKVVENKIYVICTHNVPQNATVQYNYTKTTLPFSKVLQQLTTGADGLNVLLSVLSPLTSFWTANISPLVTAHTTLPQPVPIATNFIPSGAGTGPPVANAHRLQAAQIAKSDLLKYFIPCYCGRDECIKDFLKADECALLPDEEDQLYPVAVTNLVARYQQFQVYASRKKADLLIKSITDADFFVPLQSLLKIADRSLPPDDLKVKTAEGPPLYRTEVGRPPLSGLTQVNYSLNNISTTKAGKDSSFQVFTGAFTVYKKSLFRLSVGFGWTFPSYVKNEITATGNQVSVVNDNPQAKLVVGLNIYPWGLLAPDDHFLGIASGHVLNRLSVFVGLGVPTPLQNYYGAIGYDIIPGVKIQGGIQAFYYTKNQVSNNTIIAQSNGVRAAGAFASLNLDVNFVASLLGVSK